MGGQLREASVGPRELTPRLVPSATRSRCRASHRMAGGGRPRRVGQAWASPARGDLVFGSGPAACAFVEGTAGLGRLREVAWPGLRWRPQQPRYGGSVLPAGWALARTQRSVGRRRAVPRRGSRPPGALGETFDSPSRFTGPRARLCVHACMHVGTAPGCLRQVASKTLPSELRFNSSGGQLLHHRIQ